MSVDGRDEPELDDGPNMLISSIGESLRTEECGESDISSASPPDIVDLKPLEAEISMEKLAEQFRTARINM